MRQLTCRKEPFFDRCAPHAFLGGGHIYLEILTIRLTASALSSLLYHRHYPGVNILEALYVSHESSVIFS